MVNDRHPAGNPNFPADSSSTHPGFGYAPYAPQADAFHEQSGVQGGEFAGFPAQQHPSPYGSGPSGHQGAATDTFEGLALSFGDGDPLFGAMPGAHGTPGAPAAHAADAPPMPGTAYQDDGTVHGHVGAFDAYAVQGIAQEPAHSGLDGLGGQAHPAAAPHGAWQAHQSVADGWSTGQWQADFPHDLGSPAPSPYTYSYEPAYGQGPEYGYAYGYGYDAAAGNASGAAFPDVPPDPGTARIPQQQQPYGETFGAADPVSEPESTAALPLLDLDEHAPAPAPAYAEEEGGEGTDVTGHAARAFSPDGPAGGGRGPRRGAKASASPHARGRRRSPRPRRSAVLTVAVPSVAVLGVAGAATAAVMGDGRDESETTQAAADTEDTGRPVTPSGGNDKLDRQVGGLSAADDFADRANRTQERIDLKKRQEQARARKAKEAARKEAARPKYVLPVKQRGLSARFGQSGVNWMSVHTGIDFPVQYGTTVMSAIDGTVSTKYNSAYGNMAIVTAKDGTETWYCHLGSTKIRSGKVKAGDTIAYSGSSGNSTGPHLHFEVHPGGGAAVDPLPWLHDKGLDPT